MYQAGAFFGTLFAYAIAHFLGRQRGLFIFSLVFMLGAGLMLGSCWAHAMDGRAEVSGGCTSGLPSRSTSWVSLARVHVRICTGGT